MKKLILVGALMASSFSFGQYIVVDVETRTTYKVEEIEYSGSGATYLALDENIIPTDPVDIRLINNNDPNELGLFGRKAIHGPKTAYSHNVPGSTTQEGWKNCAGTNMWWCMIVREQ